MRLRLLEKIVLPNKLQGWKCKQVNILQSLVYRFQKIECILKILKVWELSVGRMVVVRPEHIIKVDKSMNLYNKIRDHQSTFK